MSEERMLPTLAAFEAFAARFSRTLRAGDAVALEGALGSGKTAFVAASVRALHDSDATSSPTFTFWHRYEGTPPINHLDLYRIGDPAEAVELGLEEAFAPDAITFVEWPERLPGFMPQQAVLVRIQGSGDGAREIEIVRP
jgi:tRNA threonylcarbamoyl adenosine modification protein YjeE